MIFYYDATSGQAESGRFDSSGNYQSLMSFPPGTFHVGWTHIVSIVSAVSVDQTVDILFFYDATTGQVESGRLDSSGNYHSDIRIPPGWFYVGWTHIVSLVNGTVLFYDATNGQANIHLDSSFSYQSIKFYPPGTFHVGWTHIVSVGSDILLFFEEATGQTETGRLDSSGTFQSLRNYPPGTFPVGWTNIAYSIVPV